MKLIQLFVALIALSLINIPLARAQETETPTEKPSPSPAEKTEEKKSETESTKTEAEKSPAPAEKSAKKKEKAEASTTAKTSTTAAKPMAKGSVDAQLKDIEDRWGRAFQTHDATVLEGILAANHVATDETGKVLNRSGAIKKFKKSTDTLEKTTNSNVVVHPINKDAAVVTGMTHDIGKDKSGKNFDRTYRWTDTFVNRNGRWECVASHVALVAQK